MSKGAILFNECSNAQTLLIAGILKYLVKWIFWMQDILNLYLSILLLIWIFSPPLKYSYHKQLSVHCNFISNAKLK